MQEKFQELIKLLQLFDIRFMDSHESVLCLPDNMTLGKEIEIESGQAFAKDDPVVNEDSILFRVKYVFKFSCEKKEYFRTEYVVMFSFKSADVQKAAELLKIEKLKKIFVEKQLSRTIWTILRGTIMDAFNRHSLPPVQLPWII
ncbi:hypothetical protein [Fibrobacter succinogenes]|uniref:Uncharacterized protein n=1 Tax=Fibrobacter succinogenes TaxID=833 RepID=A0A380S6E9_FIBSU|nr:hypothetical protein [Fibrobacter succinogenes]PWJ35829.1 hypothetical protein IE02_1890 [Fibrobacter succinogenes subsp. elongatus]SUQ24484.1 hypothetical protein SAMN05661053_1890 [Fibrobacter succinogenes]